MTDHSGNLTADQRRGQALRFLNRDAPPDYIAKWTAHVSSERKVVQQGTKSVVIFRLESDWLALPTDMLQEVMDHYVIRTLPGHRGGIVRGLTNVRGELLLCIALEMILGIQAPGTRTPKDRMLIFSHGRFAVQVSEVFGVHRYHQSDLRLPPATLRKVSAGSYTQGILPWQGKVVACLDEALLLHAVNKGLA